MEHYITRFALDDKVTVIELPERVDVNISDELKDLLTRLVEEGRFNLVFDLSNTKYMDSSGLGAVVSRIAMTRSNKGDIRLAQAQEFISELLEITHLNQVLKCYDDLDEAINSYEQ